MATTSTSRPHTKAWIAFEQNLDSIAHMLTLVGREEDFLKTESARDAREMKRAVAQHRTLVGKSPDQQLQLAKKALAELTRLSERAKRTRQTARERMATAILWQVVILVTCVEAYLQDLLELAASADRTLMADSQRVVSCADVISATSLDELVSGMSTQWARRVLRNGGPTSWISRLTKMGVRGYPDDLAPRLELIWDIRHVVVHAAGVATAISVKRYPGVGVAAGDRVRLRITDFGVFFESVRGFLEPTERFFANRYPSLLAETVTDRVK